MAGLPDYKAKYEELKSRFMSAVDAAWEDGYQHGMADSQIDQAQQMTEQANQMNAQAGQQAPGEEAPQEGGEEAEQPVDNGPHEDELGQHIEKLESMLGKGEISSLDLSELKKTLNDIRSLQVSINLTKSMKKTKETKTKMAPLTPKVQANLPSKAKESLLLQEKILNNVFSKWSADENKAKNDIISSLNVEGITKK